MWRPCRWCCGSCARLPSPGRTSRGSKVKTVGAAAKHRGDQRCGSANVVCSRGETRPLLVYPLTNRHHGTGPMFRHRERDATGPRTGGPNTGVGTVRRRELRLRTPRLCGQPGSLAMPDAPSVSRSMPTCTGGRFTCPPGGCASGSSTTGRVREGRRRPRRPCQPLRLLLTYVYDEAADTSDLIDATDFTAPPAATVKLPPFGFHGSWIPAASRRHCPPGTAARAARVTPWPNRRTSRDRRWSICRRCTRQPCA